MRRAPVFDALETLAVRIEGQMNLAYLMAPDKRRLSEGLVALNTTMTPEGWRVFRVGWGGMMAGDMVPDLRRISLTPSPMEDSGLHAMLDQAAQKTGLSFFAPSEWNPPLRSLPKAGPAAQVAKRIARTAGGQTREVAILSVQTARPGRSEGNQVAGRGPNRGGRGENPLRSNNPEWTVARAEAQIVLLPPEERVQAREDWTQMRELWQGIRELPEEERQAKVEELLSRSDVQDRMEERRLQRDIRRSPQQRADRYQRYVERKLAAQKAGP